jgi:PAS domain S-box-containing protein
MGNDEKEIRELRRLLRDLVALATTPAVWVGRDRAQVAESVADVLLHTLRADAVYVCLRSPKKTEAVRSPQHPGFSDEVGRLWPESATSSLQVETITASAWPSALRVVMQPIGISGDEGFMVVGCAGCEFPSESEALLLSVAANQAAVALQAGRLRMQAELERHRLQDLLAKAPAAIGLLSGPEHRWLYVNENYVRVTGRNSAADFLGKTLRESLPEIETQPFMELLDGVYHTGKSYVGREMKAQLNRAQSGQPEEAYFDFVYEPLRNADGVVDGIFVHAVEVTDKVIARQEVQKRERQFREMIDTLPAAIYTTDAGGRLTHFNPAAVEFSGRTPELGTDQWCVTWKLFYPDGRPMPHDECPMAVALKEGRIIRGAEAIAERPDGVRRWFTPYPTPIRDHHGRIIGGINMLLDITERKRAEELTGHLAAIVASSDDAIVSKDLNGIIKSWNKSAERIFGYTAEEAIGQHITLIIPWERRNEEEDILRRLRNGERIDHFETVRRSKDGRFIDVSLTISPVHDGSGKIIGASKVARDITESKRAQEALRQSQGRLSAEADALVKLNEWSGRLWRSRSLKEGLDEMLGAVIELLDADKGNVQILDPEHGKLTLVAQRGFDKEFLEFFREVKVSDDSACGRALRTGERIIVEDVESDEPFAPFRHIVRQSGFRSVISSPLIAANGTPLGIVSVHFTAVQRPSEQDLHRLDLYIRQAADFIGRCRIEDALRQSEEQFRKLSESLDGEVRARTRELEERNAEVLKQSEQVRELSWRLLLTQDEERRHIARELHDSAGQTLTVLGMNLVQFVHKTGRNAPELVTDAETIQEMVQQLHRDIRTASYLLHPPLLDESGLYSALSWYTQGLVERSGLQVSLDMSEQFGRLARDVELVIFRLVQECLTNIHRHSGSKTASIRIARDPGQITVEIRDQGTGMSPERLAEVQAGASGVGIRGMRERLRQFKGNLKIESDSSGTRILVTIPITNIPVRENESNPESLQAAI